MNENLNNELITDIDKAWEILMANKSNVRVAVQVSPAARVAIGDAFGLQKGEDALGKITTALRVLGADVVLDGAIAADAMILAMAKQVQTRIQQGGKLPVIFSYKREWLRAAAEKFGVEDNALFVRPAEQSLAVAVKKMFLGDGKRTYVIAIVPCECKKKFACAGLREGGKPAVDLALTAIELADIFRSADLDLKFVPASPWDEPFGVPSGCGYISDIGGGIAEAVMRSLASDRSADGVRRIEYSGVRGYKPLRVGYGDCRSTVVCAENADSVLQAVADGSCKSAFVEVVGNPFGCIAGKGLPEADDNGLRLRAYALYSMDKRADVRIPDENSDTVALATAFAENEGNDGFDELEVSLSPFEEGVGEPAVEETPVEEAVEEAVVETVEEIPVEEMVEEAVAEEIVEEKVEIVEAEETVETVEEVPVEEAVEMVDVAEDTDETEQVEETDAEQKQKVYDPNFRRMSKTERRKLKRAKKK